MRKLSNLKKATAELRRNVELIDQCRQEFNVSMDSVTGQLIQYKDSVLGCLRTEKEQFSATAEAAITSPKLLS